MNNVPIYMDYAATTPPDPAVLESMRRCASEEFGNASSVHGFGRRARRRLDDSREAIAAAIGSEPGEIVFTSGGTEGDNAALAGVLRVARGGERSGLVVSAIEHHAVLHMADALEAQGVAVTRVPCTPEGIVDCDALRQAVTSRTALVSVMHANNETGMIQPVRVAADIAHEAGALLHSDAVQSFGKIAVSVDDLQVDLLTMSAHKLYGPKGIGVLYVRNGTRIDPMLHGGGQEGGRRAGTENVAAAVGFATAVGLAAARRDRDAKDLHGIRSRFIAHLLERFPGLVLNGSVGNALPTIVNVSFDSSAGRIDGDALIMGMDMRGVAVTSGSACTSGSLQASHVLLAMGRSPETARATVRFSFGRSTTDDECRRAADTLEDVVAMMEERPR